MLAELQLLKDHLLVFQVAIRYLDAVGSDNTWHLVWLLKLPKLRLSGTCHPYVDFWVVSFPSNWLLTGVELHLVLYMTAIKYRSLVRLLSTLRQKVDARLWGVTNSLQIFRLRLTPLEG